MRTKLVVIIALCVTVFTTCTKDVYGPDACFNENVLPIFVSNCTMNGCHNSKDKKAHLDLTTYDGIMQGVKAKHPLLSEVYKVIRGHNPSMPQAPYPRLSEKDVSTIKLWINMGAQNTSNCSTCDTINFAYDSRVKNTMQTWCVGCHNNAKSVGGGYDLSSYNGIVTAIANNKLLGSIKHSAGFIPMPQSGGQLQQCDIIAIEKWIDLGYPNN